MFNKEIGKRHFRTFPGKVAKWKKCFINNKNLVVQTTTEEIELTG